MHLLTLTLEQFRNHQGLRMDFDPAQHITYIVGPNAQGKTNILEAIYLLALTKSFRTNKHQDLIGWNKEYARVKGVFEASGSRNADRTETPRASNASDENLQLEVFLGNPPHSLKSLKKNNVKTSTADFIGTCQIVFFHPEDLNMLYLGPDLRRRYIDIMNLQINKVYYRALRNYKKILEQRNALLRNIKEGHASTKDLNIWDEQLIEQGSILMMERAKTVNFLNQHLEEYYRKISRGQEKVRIHYAHTLGQSHLENFTSRDDEINLLDEQKLKSTYQKILQKSQAKDIQARFTTVGPHRDDIEFFLNGLPLESHASRGEYRSILLSLKLLELKFFEEKTGDKPLLLLDDVFSELDENRMHMLLEAIENHQTIITTTHPQESFNQMEDLHRVHAGLSSQLSKVKVYNILEKASQ